MYLTEPPFTGEYDDFWKEGIYYCRKCNAALYKSDAKFHSGCGWPSFDQEIEGAVKKILDEDGDRIEIQCNNCKAHLGHVFTGEQMTPKNTRHCVNSYALKFIENPSPSPSLDRAGRNTEEIVFGTGCFWCTEALFKRVPGVIKTEVGYAGGNTTNPTYESVCSGNTGHAEVTKITFDPAVLSFEQLLEVFFKVHDATTLNRQGNDVGTQYRSIILFTTEEQKMAAEKAVSKFKGAVTEIKKLEKFYPAENYHSDYYAKNGSAPYCQIVISPKVKKLEEEIKDHQAQ